MKPGIVAALALTLTLCRSAVRTHESWSAAVLDAICRADGRGGPTVAVLAQTQPVIDFIALLAVSGAPVTPESAAQSAQNEEQARARFRPERVVLPTDACGFALVDRAPADVRTTLVEMSGPMTNPYDGSVGTFVRTSPGGRIGAVWTWVRLERTGPGWSVSDVVLLPVHDR